MREIDVEVVVNGTLHRAKVLPGMTLLELLRESFGLTGAKEGCGSGDCGACTVLLDGKPVSSCLTLAAEVHGRTVLTVEGLEGEDLHPVQRAFIDKAAIQCGFCTPGMIMSVVALLDENPHPSEDEIKTAIAGNLCRCTGYTKIVEAVFEAAKLMSENGGETREG